MSWEFPAEWEESAPCKSVGLEFFFSPTASTARLAKGVCDRCPFEEACLELALSSPMDLVYGVWGGKSRREREAIRLSRAAEVPS